MGNFQKYKKNSYKTSCEHLCLHDTLLRCDRSLHFNICLIFVILVVFRVLFTCVYCICSCPSYESPAVYGWVSRDGCAVSFLFWSIFVRLCIDVAMTQMCYVRLIISSQSNCGLYLCTLTHLHKISRPICFCLAASISEDLYNRRYRNCYIELNWMPVSFCVEFWWMLNTRRNLPFCLLRYVCPTAHISLWFAVFCILRSF